jgi:uncharacterized protein (DUF111 family)
VLHLLLRMDVRGGPHPGELTAPSGAATLAALSEPVSEIPAMRLRAHGRGVVHDGPDTRALTLLLGDR